MHFNVWVPNYLWFRFWLFLCSEGDIYSVLSLPLCNAIPCAYNVSSMVLPPNMHILSLLLFPSWLLRLTLSRSWQSPWQFSSHPQAKLGAPLLWQHSTLSNSLVAELTLLYCNHDVSLTRLEPFIAKEETGSGDGVRKIRKHPRHFIDIIFPEALHIHYFI